MDESISTDGSDLDAGVDVVILGAGIIGLSCAHFLLQHGRRPVIVEQGAIGHGSSHGNAGLIAPSHSIPLPAPGVLGQAVRWLFDPTSPLFIRPRADPALARWLLRFACSTQRRRMLRAIPTLRDLNRLSADLYAQVARDLGDEQIYRQEGVLNVYRSAEAFTHGRREAALLERHGVPSQVLEGEDAIEAEPGLRDGLAGAVLWPEDGFVDPAAFIATLAQDLAARGAELLTNTTVFEISPGDRGVVLRTTSGVLRCDHLVVAAGAWSAGLLRALGHRLQVEPAKGYSITLRKPSTTLRRPLLLTEAKVAATPLGDSLRLAGTMELAGLDATIDVRRLDAVRRSAEPYLRAGASGVEERIWTGLRPLSADGLPTIGRLPSDPRISIATGHGHIGVSLAPATGKLIAELVSGQTPTIDLSPLQPLRR